MRLTRAVVATGMGGSAHDGLTQGAKGDGMELWAASICTLLGIRKTPCHPPPVPSLPMTAKVEICGVSIGASTVEVPAPDGERRRADAGWAAMDGRYWLGPAALKASRSFPGAVLCCDAPAPKH